MDGDTDGYRASGDATISSWISTVMILERQMHLLLQTVMMQPTPYIQGLRRSLIMELMKTVTV